MTRRYRRRQRGLAHHLERPAEDAAEHVTEPEASLKRFFRELYKFCEGVLVQGQGK